MPSELIGQFIDRYKIVAHLQDERWGSLYKAYDPKANRTVTLQILDAQWARQEDQGEYALQVARAALRWRHTGVQRVFELMQGAVAGKVSVDVIVTEFLPGQYLDRLLQALRDEGRWVLLAEAVDIVIEVANALSYLHPRGIVHGGLTLERIAFRPGTGQGLPFQPVITALGFTPPQLSHAPSLSPMYRPPEARPGRRLDPLTDLYALAVILYQLVTAQLPAGTTFPPASTLHPGIPETLEKFLARTLDPDPDSRYADAGAFASALAALQPRLEGLTSAPSGLGQAISLSSAYQKSLNDPLYGDLEGDAVLSQTGPGTVDVSGDQIHLMTPDGNIQSYAMTGPRLTIGRSAENDIVVDRPGISRRHTRLEFDGQQYLVTDLGSTNGTYLEDNRLAPEQPQVWTTGENLRVGDVWLRLERAGQAHTTQAVASKTRPAVPAHPGRGIPETVAVFTALDGTVLDASLVRLSPDGSIGAYTDTPSLSATPGSGVNLGLLLFNRSARPDVFEITFEGLPLDWISSPPRPVGLPANGQRELQVTFRPPRTSAGRAGRHLFNIRIASQNDPSQATELRLSLTVTAFSQFFSELQPKVVQSGQVGQVIIHNRGNLPETYTVLFEDRFQEMVFDPPEMRLTVPPGKSAAVEYRPALLRPRWVGSESTHAYKVHISAQTGQLASHSGEYISRGLIPLWAPAVLAFLCVILACMALVFIRQITEAPYDQRQTAEAGETAVALATRQFALVGTQTAAFITGSNQATQLAATQTAAITNADNDQDGLSNSAEAQAGTNPDNPDSDSDQLKDGDEVNTWKTLPLAPDTDGDTLLDGVEVQRGLNPLKPDTDGDGLLDAVDPDPLLPATRTPLVIFTFTPQSPTITPIPQVQQVDLSAHITNGRTTAVSGQPVNYTIQITNHSLTPIANVQGSLAVPPSLTNVIWNCQAPPGSTCQTPNGVGNINARLDLAPLNTATIMVSALVLPSASGQVVLTFTVNPPPGARDTNPYNNQSSDVDNLPQQVSLTLTKTDNKDNIQPGQLNTYVIMVSNAGPGVVNGVSVVDNLSPLLENVQWICTATPGSSCQVPAGVGNINTMVNLAAGGAATFTVNSAVRGDASGVLNNTVSINSPVNPELNNQSASDSTLIIVPVPPSITPSLTPTLTPTTGPVPVTPDTPTPVTPSPTPVTPTPVTPTVLPDVQADVSLALSAPDSVMAGDPITYTVNIIDNGPSLATGLTLNTLIPPGAAFVTSAITSTVPNPDLSWICSPQPGQVTCSLGDLAPGGMITVELSFLAPSTPGQMAQGFDVQGIEPDPNPDNNQAEKSVTVYPK